MGDYIIRKGDNLSNIAKRLGVSVKQLQDLNDIKNPDKIIAGKTLRLPENAGTTVEHTEAKSTDTETANARKIAHQKEVDRINEMKAKQTQAEKPAVKTANSNSAVSTQKLIEDEMAIKGAPTEGGKKFGKTFGSSQYWSSMVDKISTEFGFPREILIAKISKEVTFQKNRIAGDQHGCMQIRNTAVRAMFPGAPGNWHDKYKELDEKLLNDILYKKDASGNYLKDAKGNMIPKYSSWRELLKDCNNDEISLKVGALYDKMQMAEALTAEKYGSRRVYNNLSKVIAEQKEKTNISPKENLNNIRKMETRYNGNPKYGKAITDSIVRMGMDLRKPIIKKF